MECIVCLGEAAKTVRIGDDATTDVGVCTACVGAHNGPGKFERHIGDETALRIALAVNAANLDGWADESHEAEDGTGYDRVGRFICWTTDQGFFDYSQYHSEGAARHSFSWID